MNMQWSEIEKNPDIACFNHYHGLKIPSPILGKNIEISSFNIGQGQIICIDGLIENSNDIFNYFLTHDLKPVAQDGYARNWSEEKMKVSGRISTYDIDFAQLITKELKKYLYKHHTSRNLKTNCVDGQDKNYNFIAINPYIRFVHYENHQKLIPHYDGHHYFADNIQTVMTALIYLNDCKTGHTVFLKDDLQTIEEKKLNMEKPINTKAIFSITPKKGRILLFDQFLLHSTSLLKDETKSLLLTDFIMQS